MKWSQGAGRHGGRRGRRLSARTAERLLDGLGAESDDPRAAELARLLAAAARPLPGRPEDERAALAAFRASVAERPASGPAPVPGPETVHAHPSHGADRHSVRRRRSVKVLVGGAVAAFALSGVAIAAQNGGLPNPFHTHHPGPSAPLTPGSGSASPSATGPGGSGGPAGPGTAGPSSDGPGHSSASGKQSSHTKDAGGQRMCHTYEKAVRKGWTVDSSTQERLARAAGGADHVAAYCARLIDSTSSNEHGNQPSTSARPPTPTSASPEAEGKSSSASPENTGKSSSGRSSSTPPANTAGTPTTTQTPVSGGHTTTTPPSGDGSGGTVPTEPSAPIADTAE